MTGLFLQWIKDQGGLEEMSRRADARAKLIYDVIDQSNGFYSCAVVPNARSRVNACFRIGGPAGNEELEKKFFDEAKKRRFVGVKGHRSVGGVRISMFNALPVEDAKVIADYLVQFQKENQ